MPKSPRASEVASKGEGSRPFDPAETVEVLNADGLVTVSFYSSTGDRQSHELTGKPNDEAVSETDLFDVLEGARRREGVDWRLAAALLRTEGYDVSQVYNALLPEALGDERPFEEANAEVLAAIARAYAPGSEAVALQAAGGRPLSFSAAELVQMELRPPTWLVENVIPEGVTLFAGKPKLGKSRLMRNVAFALAAGGRALGAVEVEKTGVLYLHLEGGLAGLKQHVVQLAGGPGRTVPPGLQFFTDWPRGPGGAEELGRYFEAHPECRFVVIDTFALFRQAPDGKGSMYDDDYKATQAISKVCHRYGVHACLVHHTSKRSADGLDDVLDLISGSTGLVAGCDNGAVLARTSQGVILGVRPRDLEGADLAVEWDEQLASWKVMGDAAVHNASEQQKKILEVIQDAARVGDELKAFEIAQILDMDQPKVRSQLHRMRQKTPAIVEQTRGKAWVLAARPLGEQAAPDPDAPEPPDTETPF